MDDEDGKRWHELWRSERNEGRETPRLHSRPILTIVCQCVPLPRQCLKTCRYVYGIISNRPLVDRNVSATDPQGGLPRTGRAWAIA